MTSFDEYRKKLNSKYGISTKDGSTKNEKNVTNSNANVFSPAVSTSSIAGTSFEAYRKELNAKYRTNKIDTQGVDKWFKDAETAMGDMDRYYQSNNGRYVEDFGGNEGARIANLLNSSEDVYHYLLNHKDEFENFDALDAMFSSYRTALRQYDMQNYYIKQHNLRQTGYQQTYQGKTYDEIQSILQNMEAGEEKDWLAAYSQSSEVMTPDVYQRLLSEKQAEISALEEAIYVYRARDNYTDSVAQAQYENDMAALRQAEQELDKLQEGKWYADNSAKYGSIPQNADFAAQSKVAEDKPTLKFGIQLGNNFLGVGDQVYDYINDLDGTREKVEYLADGNASNAALHKYNFMTDTEVATYNYIYNTEGKKAANEYLEYLTYELNARQQQQLAANNAEFATEHPFWASAASVPNHLLSGVGLLDVAWQNAVKGIKEGVTGEYSKPINYNTDSMSPNTRSTTIRETVAQNIVDKTGSIQLDSEKLPILSSLLNGKSFGDVYQLGMSMADSAVVALLSRWIGNFGTVLLGGAAGTQGMLEAVERGATDKQALSMGILNGVFEWLFEKIPLDNLLSMIKKGETGSFIKSVLRQALTEGGEEFGTSVANTVADIVIMAEKSDWNTLVEQYMVDNPNMSEAEASLQALRDTAVSIGWDFVGGVISGFGFGGAASAVQKGQQNAAALKTYGDSAGDLVGEALELSPDSRFVNRMQGRLDDGKTLSGGQLNRLVQKNEKAITQQDVATIEQAAISRLQELGETGDVEAIAAAISKQAAGKKLTRTEQQTIANSKYGTRLSNELNPENIQSGEYSSGWAQQLDTNRINVEEYSSLVEAAQLPQETAKTTQGKVVHQMPNVAQTVAQEAPAATVQENRTVAENATGQEPVQVADEASEVQKASITLEEASKGYGAQAQAMIHTYTTGQDVEKYDAAYRIAYDMGRSGVNLSYVKNSEATSYLSDIQKELAYEAGVAAMNAAAQEQAAQNESAANGKIGRKTGGVVRGDGVTMRDIKTAFHDTRGTAYKSLSTIAKVTGINIVLYKSETDADGNFMGAQGKYYRNREPGTIYIDINAGLETLKDVGDLEKYTVLRTFSHEFTHFIERWNPIRYNEFRKVVFDTLTERGENVDFLIEQKQNEGLDYEAASREVVAEAMTDILPDANFVQELAENHKTIFQKLLEKLKEFTENLRAYFNSLGSNRSREANALKEQIGDTVKYLDSIVKLFDQVAVQAVENYQKTVAQDEVVAKAATTETVVEEAAAEVEEKPVETKKPEAATEPEQSDFEKAFRNATQAERDEVVDAITENTKIEHMAPTEIREEVPAQTSEEVTLNVESETGSDTRAVHEPVRGSEGPARLLEGVEPESVHGSDEGRQPVQSGGDQGTADAGRDRRADAAGDVSERGPRDRVGGDLQQISDVTEKPITQEETKLHEIVVDLTAQRSTENPKGSNFVIGDSLNLPNGTKARTRANIEAIKLVKQIAAENRIATPAEQEVLSKYVGWGGLADAFGKPVSNRETRMIDYEAVKGLEAEFEELKTVLTEEEYKSARESTKNAHYTSIEVIKAMYDGLKHLGFTGGRMLEPSSGVGNFVGAMPADMTAQVKSWTMVELDHITGLFAKYLYPNADVRIQGFEETNIPDGYMDVAIGNVPFGNYAITDKHYPKAVTSAIHNYFFAKSLDKVRTGGIVMFITSSYTMNSKDSSVRKYIMQRADLLGAIRLPNTAFAGNAGTSVVTDILILKKRADRTAYEGEAFESSDWERVSTVGWEGAFVNEYFTQHPEMVLGTPKLTRGMYSSNELTYDPFTDKGSLGDQIREAMKNIQGKMEYPLQLSPERENFRQQSAKKKSQKLQVKDGVIHARDENGNLTKVDVDKDTAARITGMVAIRDAHVALCDALQQGVAKKESNALRKALNKAYDAFVEKYGYLNAPKNKKAINSFADRYAILSLENYSTEGKKVTAAKTDIFTKDTITANRTATSADNVEEGLTISLNATGMVDVSMIARLTGQQAESVTRQLIDQRLVFKDKDGNLIPAAQYLSGNVRAKLREMEGLTGIDSDYNHNVEALREVVPPTVQHTDIYVNPGANWVPVEVYESFVGYILKRSNYANYRTGKKDFSVEYVPETNEYKVAINDAYAKMSAQNTQVWGEGGKAFSTIFENMLNGRRTNVYMEGPDGNRVLDKAKTEAVAEKVEKLNEEFRKWLWEDESRRAEMQELYNETYNALVTPKYSGASLTVNGLNSTYDLRPHQKDAVARIINSGGNTLLAHRVGAGKTMEMAAAAMKLKQLGVIKKPMFVVPNNVVAQWGKEFKDYFPAANILVVGDEDMTPAERMTTINKIKNNDYDAVILAATKFEKIQMTKAWRQKFYEEQIDSILFAINAEKESQGGKGFSVKQLETKRKQLEKKLKNLTDKAKDDDGAMFEDLGVDSLFVDEAHNYKNLEYSTRMNNVSGLGKADGSQRAFDLYTKVRYLQQLNGGRGVVFATATPVMNSMTEMYIMQKYLQPDTLKQLGIEHFDSWAKMFGEVVNALEIAPSGSGYRLKQTFSKFKNVRALQQLFRSFTDVLTDVPGLKIPKMKGGKVQIVQAEQGEFQKNYMAELAKRAENVKNVDPSEDNMLKITSDGRKISYSQRMIDPSLPYEENGKIYLCCDNVYTVYQESNKTKGTQMIFCDMATPKGKAKTETETDTEEFGTVDMESAQLYDDIKSRLVQLGIPAKEIAFIHDAKNDKQKAELSEKMNNGTIRVLLGSTGKMGVGLNAQKKAVAIHHLDAPWRPGDIEQRDGRVFRQKNENAEAYKFVYVTKGSFDSRLWDILERKQKFINQVMNGEDVGNEIEDTGEVTLSAAEVKAVASDNPLIMEQVALEKEISKLQSLQQAHRAGVSRAEEKIIADRRSIATLENLIANVQADIQNRQPTYTKEKFAITIGKTNYSDKQEAGAALIAAAQAQAKEGEYTDIGSFAGFTLRVVKTRDGIEGMVAGAGNYKFKTYPLNPTFGINHLAAVVEGFEEKLEHWSKNLSEVKNDLATQKQLAAEPFAQADKLKEKRARYNEVMYILNPPAEQTVAEDVQEQSRKYLNEEENYHDERGIQAGIKESAGRDRGSQWEAVDGRNDRRDGRGSTKEKAWEKLSKRDRDRIQSAVNSLLYNPARHEEIRMFRAAIVGKSAYDMNRADILVAEEEIAKRLYSDIVDRKNPRIYIENKWSILGNVDPVIEAIYGENVNFQQRTSPLTDREVLALAAGEVKVDDMTAAEKDALDIFQKRLVKLEDLQSQRAEQGRLYKEQQFGTKVDRAAAAQTLNRMRTLDEQIQRASAEVLSVEEKTVLKRVLQKARTVVERQERQHSDEKLRRWRERRNDAAAIKKYRDRLRGDVNELTNWILHPDNKSAVKHIPDALKETVIPFLSSINFMSKRSLAGGDHTQADKAFMEQTRRLAKVMENSADIDEMYSNYTDLPPDFMQNLRNFMDAAQSIVDSNSGDFIINQMTAEELRQLSKVVRTLKKYIMMFNRFHVNAMYQHVSDASENSIDFMGQLKPAKNTGGVSQFLLWQQMRPAYAFERFGEGGKAIYDGLRRGQATLAFNTKKIMEFSEKAYTTAEVKAWENEVKTIRLGHEKTVTMRVSQIMSLYELSKRDQALGHILGEGIRVATFKNGKQKISDVGQTLTPGELNMILRELTPRQKEVADKLQQFMEKQGGAWGNHVTVARFGEKQFGEEHYFPINSDGRHLSVDANEMPGGAALYALLNMGFTKQTQENAKNRIVVYSIFDVFSNHMASMAQYNAFALPVVDALKWFNYQRKSEPDENGYRAVMGSVREQMDRAFGVPEESRPGSGRRGYAQNFVINIIKAFNGTEAQGTPYDGLGMKALHQYNLAQVAYNFRAVVQQPLAITRAAMLVDYASILKGLKLSPAAIRQNIREMREYSGIAAWKSLGFYDVNISRGLTSIIKHDDTALDRIAEVGMWGAEKADTLTWAAIWSASKEEVKRKQHISPKDAGFYEAVTKLFEEIIYKTQVVDSVLTKNEFMRDKGFFARAVGSFMSEPTTTASMLVDAYDKYHMDLQRGLNRQQAWKKNGKMIVRAAYVYGIGAVILAAVQAVADAFRDDDDYQTFVEKWLEAFGGNVVDEIMPFNKLPIISDVYELAKELLSKLGVDTYGNPPQSVFMQWYDSLVKGVEILHDKIAGEDTNYTWYGGAYKLLQAISGMTGLPMAAATREIVTAWNNIVGAMAPSLKVKTYEPSEMAQIKYAYQDGYLTDEEATAELIGQGLVDTEAEAYWTIQSWEAGDGYSRYDAIHDAVRNGGDFNAAMDELTSHGYTEKDVLSQVKSQIGEWYKTGEITKQQAINMLTKYFDMDSDEITETVNRWSSVVVTGIAYEDIKQEFMDGNITAQRAIEMRMRYGGETKEKATKTVNEWRSEKETGIAYSDIKEAFMRGDISEAEARNMYMTYGGLTEADVNEKVAVMAFVKKHPETDGISYAAIESYAEYSEAYGVPAETFYDAWKINSNTNADVDASGEAISGSKKAKVMVYINTLNLTSAQKDSLYYAFGWAESRIDEAPWH